MIRKKSKLVVLVLAFSVCSGITQSYAGSVTNHSGTDRFFRTELPHKYGNKYFVERTKETYEQDVKIKLVEKENKLGMSAWVMNSNDVRITDVVWNMSSLNHVYDIRIKDKGSAYKGKSIYLGLENAESTSINKDEIAGYVNYR